MPRRDLGRIGVVGLGSMGFGMALSLKRAGFDVAGCDVTPEISRQTFLRRGGRAPRAPAEAARDADAVVSVGLCGSRRKPFCSVPGSVAETLPTARSSFPPRRWIRTSRDAWRSSLKQHQALSRCADQRRRAARGARRTNHSCLRQQDAFAKAQAGARCDVREAL